MDIEALIAAAKEIDRKCEEQDARSQRLRELSRRSCEVEFNSIEHQQIKREAQYLGRLVTDFGDSIAALRRALKKRPKKKANPAAAMSDERGEA